MIFLRALMHGLAHACQIVGAVDQGDVRKGLREIADEVLGTRSDSSLNKPTSLQVDQP